jgi:hypothetical protein
VVHAERCLLVAFTEFVDAGLAAADVVVGEIFRAPALVFEDVQRGLRRIDHERVFLVVLQLNEIPWYAIGGPLVLVTRKARTRFVPQLREAVRRHARRRAHHLERLGSREKQVAFDEVRKPEIRRGAQHLFDFLERCFELVALDCKQRFDEERFGLR